MVILYCIVYLQRLALCAATLFFILSQDGMSLDVDKNAIGVLSLVLKDL